MHGIEKRIVYVLRSESDPARHYVGITSDVPARLEWHNHGPSGHTLSYRPWSLVVSMEFRSEREAARFEKYLKSGSDGAFAKRHFGSEIAQLNQPGAVRNTREMARCAGQDRPEDPSRPERERRDADEAAAAVRVLL